MNSETHAYLKDGLTQQGLCATPEQISKTIVWLDMLEQWGQVHNLDGLSNTKERINRLVFDSLCAHPFLRGSNILDIGSGAGAPGIPLAIFLPRNRYTLIDSKNKKVRFLERCIRTLNLSHVKACHARVEQFRAPAFETIIARGLGATARLLELSAHLAKNKTFWIIFKPLKQAQELSSFKDWHIEYIKSPMKRSLSLMLLHKTAHD